MTRRPKKSSPSAPVHHVDLEFVKALSPSSTNEVIVRPWRPGGGFGPASKLKVIGCIGGGAYSAQFRKAKAEVGTG